MAEKYKACQIYRRICDVYEEVGFSPKNVYKLAKYGFSTLNPSRKDIPCSSQ